MRSIRVYLLIGLLATITLGNFLAAVHGYRKSMQQAQALLDTQLGDTATLIETLPAARDAVLAPPGERLAYQVWTGDGQLLTRSGNAPTTPISEFSQGYRDDNFGGFRWRVLSRYSDTRDRWILVAERIDIRIELADGIIMQSILPILFCLPFIALLVWLIVGRGLALIRELAAELAHKRADDLARLQTSDPPRELEPVVAAINDLLRRLDGAVQRERRFSADAAHELRTPLSAIKVNLHNLSNVVNAPGERDAASGIIAQLEHDVGRLGHLIEQVMMLYRMTPEHYAQRMTKVDLYALAGEVIGDLYDRIERRQQNIELCGERRSVTGDAPALKIMLGNLISNASKYSPEGASIEVRISAQMGGTCVSVADTGPGLPLLELNRVLDRFYRVGGDRHNSAADGCGLGLSIVKHIAELHQATLSLHNNSDEQGGLTARVVFPDRFETPRLTGAGVP